MYHVYSNFNCFRSHSSEVEHLTHNQTVVGSNPAETTNFFIMTKEEKIIKKKKRAEQRYLKNIIRNIPKLNRKKEFGTGMDCPFDVDINGKYGTCHCGGENYNDCLGDI